MKTRTRLLVTWALISLPLVIAGWFIGGIFGLEIYISLLILLIMVALFVFIYRSSDNVLLHRHHAISLEGDVDGLLEMVSELSKSMNIPRPKVYTSDLPMPNLMVVGRTAERASIVMTGPIRELLDKEELRAAFAYEMSCIKNDDTLVSSIVAMVCGSLTALATVAMWASIFTGFGQEDDPGPMLVRFFVMSLVAPPVAIIIQLTIKESRVLKADEGAIRILRGSRKLSSALDKLQAELMSGKYYMNPSYAHLFIVNPLRDNFLRLMGLDLPTYNLLFGTHPLINKRVRRLKYSSGKVKMKVNLSDLTRTLFYSLFFYLFFIVIIIGLDTLIARDFVFERATMISAPLLGAVLLIFALLFRILSSRIDRTI